MPRPTVRVLALLEILQGGGTRTVADLAGRLGVDGRTVRRYVEHLVDLDVPVESVRGRHGGYRLAPGHRMPPLMLSDDEALAVLVGLETVRRTGGVADLASRNAAAKVRRVLPRALGARLDALLEVVGFTGPEREGAPPETDVLLLVAQAARDRRRVEVVHVRDGRATGRTVEPYGVVAHGGRWYLAGADQMSGELRTFRLDRVVEARLGEGSFEVPDGFDPAAAVLESLARTPWRHTVTVRVRGGAAELAARLPPGLATVTPVTGTQGWARVEIRAERLDWVPGVLAALDTDVVVEEPAELRDRLHALGARLLAA